MLKPLFVLRRQDGKYFDGWVSSQYGGDEHQTLWADDWKRACLLTTAESLRNKRNLRDRGIEVRRKRVKPP